MSKKGDSAGKTTKTTGTSDERSIGRIFSCDLDDAAFEPFLKYRRRGEDEDIPHVPVESVESQAHTRKERDLDKAIRRITRSFTRNYNAEWKRKNKNAAKQRAKVVAAVLREFDAYPFHGPDDWIYRMSFKDNLREVLLEYLSDPRGRVHIHEDGIMVPAEYYLSGQSSGFRTLKATQNIPRLVTEALVWKSRRMLGCLWTFAEQGESDALLRLAQIIVPLVKSINEKISTDAQVLGCWPKELPFWPVLKSPHHDFDCDHRKFLGLLQVGKDFPFTISEESRWTARDAIGKWAIHLCKEIEIDQECRAIDDDPAPWARKLLELKPFSSNTWEDWWIVAKGLLRLDYIDVVEIPELNGTVKSSADRLSPGRIRKRILQALKEKFKSMAWENKS
jgi:hypothetical protein